MVDSTLNEQEAAKRRKAIHYGLAEFLEKQELLSALWIWEKEFGKTPSAFDSLYSFTKRVCEHFNKISIRSDIHNSLLNAMLMPENELGTDPHREMLAMQSTSPPPAKAIVPPKPAAAVTTTVSVEEELAKNIPAANIVFSVLLQSILNQIDKQRKEDGVECRNYLAEIILKLQLSSIANIELRGFILTQKPKFLLKAYSREQMSQLLHTLYIWMCQYVGPVMSDTIMATALRSAESLPESSQFSPRSLL